MPFIKKYFHPNSQYLEGQDDEFEDEDENIRTRVFSDCFRSNQVSDFKKEGFILKRVNHRKCFGAGNLHKNTIESLLHQIKLLADDFSGLSVEKLKIMFNNDEKPIIKYLDGWICYALTIREMRRKKIKLAK